MEKAQLCGLKLVGVRAIEPLTEDRERLQVWQERGQAGELSYMLRDPALLADPLRLCGFAGTAISLAVHYDRRPRPERRQGEARVARYAWGRDYHRVLKRRIETLATLLAKELGAGIEVRSFTDAVPLLERSLARRAGLGFIGKNTLLITYREGSYSLLGEIFIRASLKVPALALLPEVRSGCGSCTRCQTACPTQALVADYTLDARRCISYLSIEKRGMLAAWERAALGEWIFGCDICQDVCPYNHRTLKLCAKPELAELGYEHGCGPLLHLSDVFSMRSDAQYLKAFSGTPLMRARREGLIRNGLCVARNTRCEELIPAIRELAGGDTSEVVRAIAWWALRELNPSEDLSSGLRDPSAVVIKELECRENSSLK